MLELAKKRMFQPEDIQRIRTANRMSQTVFAVMPGVGKTTVQQWEQIYPKICQACFVISVSEEHVTGVNKAFSW